MPGRIHQNDAPSLTLDSPISVGDTIIPVQESITGVETPISYTINSGGANQEIVTLVDKNTSTTPSQFENCVRGCDGTADQSHSSGEVLTHEATARDLVDKDLLHSQIIKPSDRIRGYQNFDRPDTTNISDVDAPEGSGSFYDVLGGVYSVQDKRLYANPYNQKYILWPVNNIFAEREILLSTADGYFQFVIWQDADNKINFETGKLVKTYQGTTTTIENGGGPLKGGPFRVSNSIYEMRNPDIQIRLRYHGGFWQFNFNKTEYPELNTIIQNATHYGYFARFGTSIEYIKVMNKNT